MKKIEFNIRTPKLKDIKTVINLKTCEKLLSMMEPAAYIAGSLLDNYAFVNYDYDKRLGVHFGKHLPRHYILVQEKYLTSWSSELVVTETNNDHKFESFIKEAESLDYGEVYC